MLLGNWGGETQQGMWMTAPDMVRELTRIPLIPWTQVLYTLSCKQKRGINCTFLVFGLSPPHSEHIWKIISPRRHQTHSTPTLWKTPPSSVCSAAFRPRTSDFSPQDYLCSGGVFPSHSLNHKPHKHPTIFCSLCSTVIGNYTSRNSSGTLKCQVLLWKH